MPQLTDLLIGKGFFPHAAIPSLKSEKLADVLSQLPALGGYEPKMSKSCVHSIPKRKKFRRLLAVPNPLHQIPLCQVLGNHWPALSTHCNRSRISASTPVLPADGSRALVSKLNRTETQEERIRRSTSARVLLKADISRFYPSLYTHSIPWALHGKEVAKGNHSDDLIGNQIDKCVRNAQDKQTLGVPIGPDSSFLIAEVIASSIDLELESRLDQLLGVRYIDDFWLYLPDRASADKALVTLHAVTKAFELELNDLKTEILDLPDEIEPYWLSELRGHRFRSKAGPQRTDLVSYFSKAFGFAVANPLDSVLTYALKTSQNRKILPENWPLYESLLLNAVIAEPSALPAFSGILAAYREMDGVLLDGERIAATLGEICLHHAELQHGYEVAWSLFIARRHDLKLPGKAIAAVAQMDDAIVALAALDLICSGTVDRPDLTLWKGMMSSDSLYSEQWLLAYEALVKGWLPSVHGVDYVLADDFFGTLCTLGVQFYDSGVMTPAAEIGY